MDVPRQLLENCRWLFNQEVKIITFRHGRPNNSSSGIWRAVIVPKEFSLISLAQCDINEKILFRASANCYDSASEAAIHALDREIGNKIGQIFQFKPNGSLRVVESEIPKCDVPITTEPTKTPATSSSTQTDPVLNESAEKQRGDQREEPIQMETKEASKEKEKEDKVEKQSAWRWAPGPSGRLYWKEYEPEALNADNLSSLMKTSGPATTSTRGAGFNLGTSTASGKTKTRRSLLPIPNKRHSSSSSSSSSSQQPPIEISSEYATSSSEINFTDSDSDSETTTVPGLDRFDPVGTDQQMVRDEIKFAMRDLIKCLAEHVEGIS